MSSGSFPDVLPEMNIHESNGEVSASIQETNRVRALLGLKPLNVGSASSSHSKSKHNNNAAQDTPNSNKVNKPRSNVDELEKLHLKLSTKHKLESTMRGISLAQELQTNSLENYSAADWVKKSRQLEKKQKKEKKLQLYEEEEEDDIVIDDIDSEDRKHLKGKIVNHDLSSFKKGETKILILKDSKILDSNLDLNQEEDELINVEMYENEVRQKKANQIENIKRNRKYDPFDEQNNDELLPQYKEKNDITKNLNAFTLNEQGNIDKNARNNKILAELNDLDGNEKKRKFISYDLSDLSANTRIESDYIVTFKKKKKRKKKKRKRQREHGNDSKRAKKRKIEIDGDIPIELADEYKGKKYAFLDSAEVATNKSFGKRDEILNALKLSEMEEAKERERMKRYNTALSKANKSMIANLAMNEILAEFAKGEESEEDEIFNNTLQRAQILGAKQLNDDGTQTNTEKILEENENENNKMMIDDEDGITVNITSQFSDGLNNVINEMNEYENDMILQQQQQRESEQYDIEHAMIVDNEHGNDKDHAEDGGWIECDNDENRNKIKAKETGKAESEPEPEPEALDASILEREPLVCHSMAETMLHIKRRGYLENEGGEESVDGVSRLSSANIGISKQKKEEIKKWSVEKVLKWLKKSDNYLYQKFRENFLLKRIDGLQLLNSCSSSSFLRGVIGMGNNEYDISKFFKILGELCGDPAPDINLTHNDDYGQPMTAKEAFRKLSHKFHGKKSGPKKEEKRIKKRNIELQRKINNYIDTPLQTLTKLKQTTETLNKPFVVLDKH